MKSLSYLFMAGLMTLGLWSCSDDANLNSENGEGQTSADKVYMSFKLELPTASRSTTDETGDTNSDATPDYEVGTEEENTVSRLDVVLAKKENDAYVYLTQSKDADMTLGGENDSYVATFDATEVIQNVAGQSIYVFVFCNYNSGTINQNIFISETKATVNGIGDIATADHFLMANATVAETPINMPSAENYGDYSSPTSPLYLGQVEVERAAARFDFKSINNNTYVLDASNQVTVTLTHMALVNMSNGFNILRRVAGDSDSDNIADYNSASICGVETPTNYVVDSDAADKLSNNYLPNNFLNYWDSTTPNANTGNAISASGLMNFANLWTNLGAEEKTVVSTLNVNDNWNSTGTTGTGDYKVWRYATENTLPSINSQKKSLSTAVLFRGELNVGNSDDRLSGEKAYVYNDVLYGQWSDIQDEVASYSGTDENLLRLKSAYEAANQTIVSPGTEPTLAKAAAAGFTVYQSEGTGENKCWPVYYYYINKHNTNNDDNAMGPMEFAVVRNNVYKLSVTEINKFGHPGNPEGDPDPVDPNDPDESKNVYFKVAVKVLPWTVRVNDIKF